MKGEQQKKQENLWNKILGEAVNKRESKDANILILGDKGTGKRTLIQAIERYTGDKLNLESRNDNSIVNIMKDKKIASFVDYRYYSIKNPDDENMELAKVNLWFIDENSDKDLTELILTSDKLSNFMVFIVLNFEEYWNTVSSASKWIQFINERVAPAFTNLDLEESDKIRNRMKDLVMNFHEPHENENGKILNRKTDIDPESADNLFIPKGALNPNYGFPILFIMNRAEHILEIKDTPNAGEVLAAIEYNLRKFAVSYAAPIVYTSIKRNTNIELLLDYVKFLFFQIPFPHHSNLSKDNLFIPMGYDNLDIIEEGYPKVKDKPFEMLVKKPQEEERQKDAEINVQEHQKFLKHLQDKGFKARTNKRVGKVPTANAAKERKDRKDRKNRKKAGGYSTNQTQKILSLLNRDSKKKEEEKKKETIEEKKKETVEERKKETVEEKKNETVEEKKDN